MKKFLKWVGLGFLGLFVLGIVVTAMQSPEQRAAARAAREQRNAEQAQAEAEKVRQELASLPAITASELADAYDANTVAADQRFKGKKFKVTGTVSDINTDVLGNPYLVLRASGNPFLLPHFSFDDDAKSQLAQVRKGNKVTLICTGRGDVAKIPMSGNCVLL